MAGGRGIFPGGRPVRGSGGKMVCRSAITCWKRYPSFSDTGLGDFPWLWVVRKEIDHTDKGHMGHCQDAKRWLSHRLAPHVVEGFGALVSGTLFPLFLICFYVGILLLHITHVMQEKLIPSQGPGWMQAGWSSLEPSLPLLEHLLVQGWTWDLNWPKLKGRDGMEDSRTNPLPLFLPFSVSGSQRANVKGLLNNLITWGKQKHDAFLMFFNDLPNCALSDFFLRPSYISRADLIVSGHFHYLDLQRSWFNL